MSPNYPKNYEDYQDCIWNIIVPAGWSVSLDFHDFDVSYNSISSVLTNEQKKKYLFPD